MTKRRSVRGKARTKRYSPAVNPSAAAFYRRLHEGLPAKRAFKQAVPQPVKQGRAMIGWIEQIQYTKETPEGTPAYWHPHERHAQPELWRDGRGKLFVYGCNYVVTDRGIEDMPPGRFTRVCQNLRPKTLVTLGVLSWIRYRRSNGSSGILQFEGRARPDLALDETGKLHLLGGHHNVEVDPMARRRHRRHHAMRFNPRSAGGGDLMSKTKRYGMAFAALGAGVFVGSMALNYVATKLPAMNPYVRAAAKAGIGIGAGVLVLAYSPSKQVADIVAPGLGAAGVLLGINDAYAAYRSRAAAGVYALPAARRPGVAAQAFARRAV